MKLAEMTPMIIALSAVKIIVMNIICANMINSCNKVATYYLIFYNNSIKSSIIFLLIIILIHNEIVLIKMEDK